MLDNEEGLTASDEYDSCKVQKASYFSGSKS